MALLELEQAERSLRSSKVLFDDGDTDGSANRLYYALFHAARAALISECDTELPRSHSGLIGAFGSHLVKPGKIALELGKLFNRVQHERLLADYSGEAVDAKSLPELIVQGVKFVATMRTLVQNSLSGSNR